MILYQIGLFVVVGTLIRFVMMQLRKDVPKNKQLLGVISTLETFVLAAFGIVLGLTSTVSLQTMILVALVSVCIVHLAATVITKILDKKTK